MKYLVSLFMLVSVAHANDLQTFVDQQMCHKFAEQAGHYTRLHYREKTLEELNDKLNQVEMKAFAFCVSEMLEKK